MVAVPQYAYRSAVVGSLSREQSQRVMGTYLTCKGIHLPKEDSPRKLAPVPRQFWEHAKAQANSHYRDESIAEKTAWKTLRLFFRDPFHSDQMFDALPAPGAVTSFIGDVGDLVRCGVCLEATYIDASANLNIIKYRDGSAPSLYWSERFKSLYIFPQLEEHQVAPDQQMLNPAAVCQVPDQESLGAKTFKRWTMRDSKCARAIDIPEVNLALLGNCDTFVYRSDKWHDANPDKALRGSQEYIHQVGDGVGFWFNDEAVAIQGGCMDLEERGIIH